MSKLRVDGLPVDAVVVLHAQVVSRDSVALWHRVGTLHATESGMEVAWDADTRFLAPMWRPGARVGEAPRGEGLTIRFGVIVGRRNVRVGETRVAAEQLWQLRRQLRGEGERAPRGLGVGPRGPRSAWPRM